jgi:hypothetical protein
MMSHGSAADNASRPNRRAQCAVVPNSSTHLRAQRLAHVLGPAVVGQAVAPDEFP